MNKQDLKKKLKMEVKVALGRIMFALILIATITGCQNSSNYKKSKNDEEKADFTNRLAYEITSEEKQYKVRLDSEKGVLKEKGKEAIYPIIVDNGHYVYDVSIPESTYNEYFGNKYNAITVTKEILTIYVANKPNDFKKCKASYLIGVYYPWDKNIKKFTKDDAKKMIELRKKGKFNDSSINELKQKLNLPNKCYYTLLYDLSASCDMNEIIRYKE